ncbi:hypothetical protein N865_21200 [Intrasporangium oryzae NRRL B-24470]|uniref:Uncharacterized protein n=1 Tax=Intrasporangium oryzae NRRL B-24470 TaxID=1386089 RepID=W9G183_9MICO|nr:hypothetical protein [Intrasporangium oryzae]EWS99699.1 hypothetical protein N865_21200 [Intrasporangium oryzae NRRL B-24470]
MQAVYDQVLSAAPVDDPWTHAAGGTPTYAPAFNVLADLLTSAVRHGAASEDGIFPKGIDLWLSYELRRSGFRDQETWPRSERPRVMTREVMALIEALPTRVTGFRGLNVRDIVRQRANEIPAVTPTNAVVLGRAYNKQVDVVIARWDRGPELLASTKAQLSSFGKNLPNRFEEAVGDAANLTSRYPLTAVGFFFLQRATILTSEPDVFERTVDMMRKLRSHAPGQGYTSTGLCLVDWDETLPVTQRTVDVLLDRVPPDLRPDRFMIEMIEYVLAKTPITEHVPVREGYERRDLAVVEGEDVEGEDVEVGEVEVGEVEVEDVVVGEEDSGRDGQPTLL